jgi:hypothetical protein
MGSATPPHRRRTSDLALDRSRTCHEVVGNHRPTRGVRRGVHRAAKRPVRRVTYSSEVRNVPDVRNFVYPNWDPSEPPLVADYLVGGTRVNRMRRLSHSRFCKQHRDRCSKRAQRSGVPLTGLPGPAARRRWRTAYPGVRNPASFSFLAAWATEGSTYREQTRANG